jgi:hypothetical protein
MKCPCMVTCTAVYDERKLFPEGFSVDVWYVILGNKLIGPFLLDHHITGNIYEMFLRNESPGLLEGVPLITRCMMCRHHDGAPLH